MKDWQLQQFTCLLWLCLYLDWDMSYIILIYSSIQVKQKNHNFHHFNDTDCIQESLPTPFNKNLALIPDTDITTPAFEC